MKIMLKLFWMAIFLFVVMVGNMFAQIDTLVILHLSDTHSHLMPYGPRDSQGNSTLGGISRVATIIKEVKNAEKNVLLFHAGDLFTGDFMSNKYYIVPELQFLKDIGFCALTIGNHEFDRTPETLKRALSEAGFPHPGFDLLSANLDLSQEPTLAELIKPYTIKQVGNLKLGIFGLTIEKTTNDFSFPDPVFVTDYIAAGKAAVESLRTRCDLVIGLTHLGFELDSALVKNIAGIDLIFGGHDHRAHFAPKAVTNPEGKTTWIARAGEFYNYLGYMKLAYSPSEVRILEYELKLIDNTVAPDPEVEAIVKALKDSLQADPRYGPVYDEIIAEATVEINRNIRPWFKDSPLGNLVTDAFRNATGTDIAIDAAGFLRQEILKGPLSGSDIFQTISDGYNENTGYGFNLVTFQLSGASLRSGLAFTAIESMTDGDLYVQVSGLELTYDTRFPSIIMIIKGLTIGGKPYKLDSLYTITATDRLASFLSYAGLEPVNLQETGLTEYEIVRDYIKANSPIAYYSEGRIKNVAYTDVDSYDEESVATTFELHQNHPNPFSATSRNSGTKINYYLPALKIEAGSSVVLKVYNVLGQEIVILVNKNQPPGWHSASWNGRDVNGFQVPSGIYFYRLELKGTILTRKMLLLH